MPAPRFAIAPHSAWLTTGFIAAAAAITLTLAAGPALAQDATQLNRVEVAGQPMTPARYDVHAACAQIEDQLERPLQSAWFREQTPAEINVSFVLHGNRVTEVHTQGDASGYRDAIKHAVRSLQCSDLQASASPQVFAFQVAFIDADAPGAPQVASAGKPYRIAMLRR